MAHREPLTAVEQAQLLREISHELRTPLGAAMIWIRIYREGREDAQKTRAISMFEDSLSELLQLAQDLSDCSALMESRLALERSPLSLNRLVSDLARGLAPRAEGRGIRLEIASDAEEISVEADRERLGRALDSILRFAVTVHTPDSSLAIGLAAEDDCAVLQVPLKAANMAALKPLGEHLREGASKLGPSGLTLPIAVELIQLHGGTVEGTTSADGDQVRVRIPIRSDAADATPDGRD